jgi:mRNA interferase MazF
MLAEKITISLGADTLNFVESYQKTHAMRSRSQVIETAVALLREKELEKSYRLAAQEADADYDANKRAASTITVLPITSNITNVFPFEIRLTGKDSGLPKDSKARAQQIRTISKERIASRAVGRLAANKMALVDAAIRLHLGL